MELKAYLVISVVALTVFSSGCVEDIDEDGPVGQVLDIFGNFSSDGNSSTYEFSLDSLTDNAVMAPIQGTVDEFKNNVSSREGVEMKSTKVKLVNVSSDSITVLLDYKIESEEQGTFNRNTTFTMVNRNGSWQLKDPVKDNLDNYQNESRSN
ncbi:hypothetical protein AQV86_00110 [Nanohaloarchaea archaeon SG9]|nr:hypothetical protein AQV86_00110 [Nanohaloarchaea archaeon SG9]